MKNENDFLREVLEMPYYSLVPKILMNALRLGVFDELKMPQESGQLAEKKGWNRENTEIFLQTLFSLEYLIKDVVQEAGIKAGFTAVCKKALLTSGGHLDLDMDVLRKENR